MVSKESVRELIEDYSAEKFIGVLKKACAPATFVSVGKEYVFREAGETKVCLLGVVKDLPGENGLSAPLLVADVPLNTVLTERSSRIRQFKLAKKVLQYFAATPPMELDGVTAQGVFVFHDTEGRFRVSLVTATPENGSFNWSKARRQSFYVTNDPDANATFVQRMCMNWGTLKGIKEAFSVEKLTKEFYNQLFAWYERVCDDERVEYPNGLDTDADNREDKNRKHIIRLITRLMFVWFLKQKKLVPDSLFDEEELKRVLKNFNPVGRKQHQYYRAILQNLFFATLNSEVEERGFAESPNPRSSDGKTMTRHHGVKTKYRYADEFAISKREVLELFRPIPFLNGGLFECLDQENADGKVMYYDGFSLQERHRDHGTLTWAHVPNDLFFDPDYGIIPLLKRYNFTVEENSPGDEDVALDPELLGKVFENLLGAFNPETEEIVRKSTGSFYTPREIVNYMVDESLIAYLTSSGGSRSCATDEKNIRSLVTDGVRPTDDALCIRLAEAIEKAKILDPACGSGAFPMGALLKMVELLRILKELPEGVNLYDLKLKLIENCIFGSDIQEIAVQISKLRIFISLVCEQKPNMTKPNYGINTLPNLETKFVAANSLIALKREPQGELFYEMGAVKETKDALWDVRHKHFLAKTRREKNELRKQDKELREKLAAAAKKTGYSEESTRLMSSWDPYNQNVHAEFFDPEWMFNVKDGFDIVIGNPPWIESAEIGGDVKGVYEQIYVTTKGQYDIFCCFIEQGIRLIKSQGNLFYILPDRFLTNVSYRPTREFLLTNVRLALLIALGDGIFENVAMPSAILGLGKCRNGRGVVCKNKLYGKPTIKPQEMFRTNDGLIFNVFSTLEVDNMLHRIKANNLPLSEFFDNGRGVECGKKCSAIIPSRELNTVPLIRGEDMGRYIVQTGAYLRFGVASINYKDDSFYHGEKILVRKTGEGINAAYDNEYRYFLQCVYCFKPKANCRLNIKCILGVLNSRLMAFYYFNTFGEKGRKTFPHLVQSKLLQLPIINETSSQHDQIVELVDRIIAAKKRNPAADTSALEREIDEKVYRLYGLTDDEIRVIEGKDKEDGGGGREATAIPNGHHADVTLPSDSRVRTPGVPKKRKPKIVEEF